MRLLISCVLAAVTLTPAIAQSTAQAPIQPQLSVTPGAGGDGHALDLRADDAPVSALLALAAGKSGLQLRIDPAALARLGPLTTTVDRRSITVDELALLLTHETGLAVVADDKTISVSAAPTGGGSASARGHSLALRQFDHALVAPPDVKLMPELLAAQGHMLLDSGRAAEAVDAFESTARQYPGKATAQEGRLFGAIAALAAGHPDDAVRLATALEAAHADLPALAGAALVGAAAYAAAGDHDAALLRLRRVVQFGARDRDRALASLLAAETAWHAGRGPEMLAALEAFNSDLRRTFPDLAALTPLPTALALVATGSPREALLHFRVAMRVVPGSVRRADAAREMALTMVALNEMLPALAIIRQAAALTDDAGAQARIAVVRCEIEEQLGLWPEALGTATHVLAGGQLDAAGTARVFTVVARAAEAMSDLPQARAALDELATHDSCRADALLMRAGIEQRAGNAARGIEALDALDACTDAMAPGQRAAAQRLRGELWLALGQPLKAAAVFGAASGEKK